MSATRRRAALLATAAWLPVAGAGAQTAIVPDSGAGFSTGTTVDQAGTTFFINDGELAGANLFHSFNAFTLGAGDSAVWNAPASGGAGIANVINRVTGGAVSDINGGLSLADMPGASFWFINPAGIVFGEGASVDVPGAAYFATAHELRLGDGAVFSTVTPDGSSFSSAPPEAFGFLGGQGDLALEGVRDAAAAGGFSTASSLWLGGANVIVRDSSFSVAALDLRAVGNGNHAIPVDPTGDSGALRGAIIIGSGSRITLGAGASTLTAGNIRLNDAGIDGGTGDILLRANDVALSNAASVTTLNSGAADAGAIRVEASNSLLLTSGSAIRTAALSGSTGDAGDISLIVGRLLSLEDNSDIAASTEGEGNAGDIRLRVGTSGEGSGVVSISGRSNIISSSLSGASGAAGDISIEAGESLSLSAARIQSETDGADDAGEIELSAGLINLEDDTRVSTTTRAEGDAGNVRIEATALEVTGGSRIRSVAARGSQGSAGSIAIATESLVLGGADDGALTSRITTSTGGLGPGGSITIDTGTALLRSGADITSAVELGSPGDGGSIVLTARESWTMESASRIFTDTTGSGDAGPITLRAPKIELRGGAAITSTATAGSTGESGDITIFAEDALMLSSGATIASDANGAGNAGAISIDARSLEMSAGLISSDTFGDGGAGAISLRIGDGLLLADQSEIRSETEGAGNAGGVSISAESVELAGRSFVSTNTRDVGDAGNIRIEATALEVTGGSRVRSVAAIGSQGSAGSIAVATESLVLGGADDGALSSRIITSTGGLGAGGSIDIATGTALLRFGAAITSAAELGSPGGGGNIVLTARESWTMESASRIFTDTTGSGDAGTITLRAPIIELTGGAAITSTATVGSTGQGGDITIFAEDALMLSSGATIGSDANGAGDAGNLLIQAGVLDMSASTISTNATGRGDAGGISISAGDILLDRAVVASASDGRTSGNAGTILIAADRNLDSRFSSIRSETQGRGNAGAIDLRAARIVLEGTGIRTSSDRPNAGGAGEIVIAATESLLMSRAIVANDVTGVGQPAGIFITAPRIDLTRLSRISSGTFGESDGGTITITATDLNVIDNSRIRAQSARDASGDAGDIVIEAARSFTMDGVSRVNAGTAGSGDAGSIRISTATMRLLGGSDIFSNAFPGAPGNAGSVDIIASNSLLLDASSITTATNSTAFSAESDEGDRASPRAAAAGPEEGGRISIASDDIRLVNGSLISSSSFDTRDAGAIAITAGALAVVDSEISSSALDPAGGGSGSIVIAARDSVDLIRASIETLSINDLAAGSISVSGERVILADASAITSDNTGASGGAAGSIAVAGEEIRLFDGSSITSDAVSGPAGSITLTLPETGVLELSGEPPSVISTTSGPGAGGRITIANPYLILSDGGSILALGEQGGANVSIESEFFLRSADRLNLVSVEGSLVLDSQIGDLSAGAIAGGVDFLDASATLRGRCAATRATGQVSQFSVQPTGIYSPVAEPRETPAEQAPQPFSAGPGGCV